MSSDDSKSQILKCLDDLTIEGTGGIASWLCNAPDLVFEELARIEQEPLSHVRLNQLLVLGHQAPMSRGFYEYYWLGVPDEQLYDIESAGALDQHWLSGSTIGSLNHLRWGLNRLFIDSLLRFGNVRTGYRTLRKKTRGEISAFFLQARIDSEAMMCRGQALPLLQIEREDRYLVGEKASALKENIVEEALLCAYRDYGGSGSTITFGKLAQQSLPKKFSNVKDMLPFIMHSVCDENVEEESDISEAVREIREKFKVIQDDAKSNTERYLSAVGELDVYVATSMGEPNQFEAMADFCQDIFSNSILDKFNLRYFDPTISVADNKEDKGLIECLMVKCAKVLIYYAEPGPSYGKAAEAAMALSLGKRVIFYAPSKPDMFRDVHPLTRLIEFSTGVAVGGLVTSSKQEIPKLLDEIFENRLRYSLEKDNCGYLRLRENRTRSVVRLQTSDTMISETFWNHYNEG